MILVMAITLLSALILALLPSLQAQDWCTHARSPAEKAICANPKLRALDREIQDAFAQAKSETKALPSLKSSQKAWLKERDRCGPKEACLALQMEKRIAALKPKANKGGFEMKSHEGPSVEVSYPQLTTLATPAIRSKINARLRELAQLEGCASETGHWSVQSEASHPFPRIFTVAMDFDWFCGGPYPEAYRQWLTFDLQTGEELSLEQIAFDASAAERMRARVRSAPVKPKDCESPLEEIDSESTLRIGLKATGLSIRPSFPHVLRACEREVVISPEEFSRQLKKELLR